MSITDKLNFDSNGLVPVVIQDAVSGRVLTLCYMDIGALEKTLEEKKIYVFRRSKGRIMLKGETSGCEQTVKEVYVDCANNSVLFKVGQTKAACHEGYFSCYFRKIDEEGKEIVEEERVFDPGDVYK
ncbi:MAG: phosphoribosyl-AMP cyclohydrolase [Candidatus Omnitrophota bacterium]